MEALGHLLRRMLAPGDRAQARRMQTELAWRDVQREERQRHAFLDALRCDERSDRVLLGRAQRPCGAWQWCGLEAERLLAGHVLMNGATGGGKTRLLAAVLLQLLLKHTPQVVVDLKSELTQIYCEYLLPAIATRPEGQDLAARVRIIQPFDPDRVPMLRLTAPELGVPRDIQALTLANALNEASGTDMGVRMHSIYLRPAALAIERNLPLTVLEEWFRDPRRFARDARTSEDSDVRRYAQNDFPRENQASVDALRARLSLIFHLSCVRDALQAPWCISLSEALEDGVTILDFGSPPSGAEDAVPLLGGPLLGRLCRAILSRPVTRDTKQMLIVFEEFPELLRRHQAQQFSRMLSLARFKRVTLWFCHQELRQVAAVDPVLLHAMRTNTATELAFRSSIEDARLLAQGIVARSGSESLAAAQARFVEEAATLGRREYFLWLKESPFGPQRLRSPRFDLEPLTQAAAGLPDEVRQALRQGTESMPRGDCPDRLAPAGSDAVQLFPGTRPRRRSPRLG
ncbi:MAG: type IV secretion system DNA-binding domain-containing protein [Candidatus Eisenbacteria bacterium]|nr:type IV secretion system DNA-binding domain-containing protein [Candidatus Eisenbacteria bacterium]